MGSLFFKLARMVLSRKGSSWLFSTILMLVWKLLKKVFKRKELVDLSKSKPGDKFIVEHLPITHGEQIKQIKRDKKALKKKRKANKKSR